MDNPILLVAFLLVPAISCVIMYFVCIYCKNPKLIWQSLLISSCFSLIVMGIPFIVSIGDFGVLLWIPFLLITFLSNVLLALITCAIIKATADKGYELCLKIAKSKNRTIDTKGAETKIKRIILITLLVFLAGTITYYATAEWRALRHAYREIPIVTRFYEENKDFFDLLLDIRDRIILFNIENEDTISELDFTIYSEKELLRVRVSGPDGYTYPGFQLDLLTPDERHLIDMTLRKIERPEEMFIGVRVQERYIEVYGLFWGRSEDAWISLVSPVSEAKPLTYMGPWKSYIEPFNDDWSVVIQTRFRN